MIRTRVIRNGVELQGWSTRSAPDLLTTPADRASDAVGFACATYPVGSVVEYEIRSWSSEGYATSIARWEIVQTGWFVDDEGRRHEKPGAALVRVEGFEKLDDPLFRIRVCEGELELENIDLVLATWQRVIDTGEAWTLQGWYGRRARELIELGLCRFASSEEWLKGR